MIRTLLINHVFTYIGVFLSITCCADINLYKAVTRKGYITPLNIIPNKKPMALKQTTD